MPPDRGAAPRGFGRRGGRRQNGAVPTSRLPCLLLLAVAGCRVGGVETLPFRGPVPRTILIWPALAEPFAAQQPALFAGLDLAVRRRGHGVVASAVARQLLADGGLGPDANDGERIRRATGADAVLRLTVRRFDVHGDRLQSADWDLAWQLESLHSGALLWQFSHHGHWDRRAPVDEHPQPRLDEDYPPVLFGDRRADFRDAADLAAWLHRFALERMPRGDA